MSSNGRALSNQISTGVEGLDAILRGGFIRNRTYLIQGGSGTGKTTLGLQFLLQGVKEKDRCLYISVLQNSQDLYTIAASHGWNLEGVQIEELSSVLEKDALASEQTLFHTAHVELGETVEAIRRTVERVAPDRLVFDSISEIRLLADTPHRYRRQVIALKQFLSSCECTVLIMAGDTSVGEEDDFRALADGAIFLEQRSPLFGQVRRYLEVSKMRGMSYVSGCHDFRIVSGGLVVYPRLVPHDKVPYLGRGVLTSSVGELDSILGGGMQKGTTTLIMGASGVGKSTLATLYAYSAAKQGERSTIFLFDENIELFLQRSEGLGMNIGPFVKDGIIDLKRISMGEISPGEFSHKIRQSIEETNAKVIIIDSLSGYYSAMAEEKLLIAHMHELMAYTSSRGVLTLLLVAEHGLIGTGMPEPHSTSMLADTVLLLRFFEAQGSIRRAISVFKKRYGDHEKTIREMRITPDGIQVGKPLSVFTGVLTGVPSFHGRSAELMQQREQ